MTYEVTLLVFGILLLLVGLLGKVKAKELEVGTSSTVARLVMASLGILLVVLSFNPDIARSWLFSSPRVSTQPEGQTPPEPAEPENARSRNDATPSPEIDVSQPVQVVRVGMSASVFNSYGFITPQRQIVAFGPTPDRTSFEIAWTEGASVRRGQARVLQQRNDDGFAPFLVSLALPERLSPPPQLRIRNAMSLRPGDEVERYLSSTDRTPGEVLEVGVDAPQLRLRRALVTTNISGPGQAGAPVLDADGRLIGIVIGADKDRTFVMPIETVKIAFPSAF